MQRPFQTVYYSFNFYFKANIKFLKLKFTFEKI